MMAPSRQSGFSLLEIMVVLVIIGTMAVIVVLNYNPPENREELEKSAKRFQLVFDLAADFAVLNHQEMGVRVDLENHSYLFMILDEEQKWQIFNQHKAFAEEVMPEEVTLELQLDGLPWIDENNLFDAEIFDEELSVSDEETEIGEDEEEELDPPQIFLFASGEFTPFSLIFKFEPEFGDEDVAYFKVNGIDFPPLELEGPLDTL